MRIIYYDTETTGISVEQDRIIEIAAYDPLMNKSFSSLINPFCPIPKEASDIHHITDEMVKEAPEFRSAALQFIEFCSGDVLLVAHNNDSFDQPFLLKELKKVDLDLPKNFQFLDSLKWARKYRKDLPRHSLQYLREFYGIPENQAHRALNDVMTLFHVFSKMTDDLSPKEIFDLLNTQPHVTNSTNPTGPTMPFGKYKGRPLHELPKHYVNWLKENQILEKEENKNLFEQIKQLGLLEI